MWFSRSSGKITLPFIRRDYFFSGALLLILGGWMALNPLPGPPDLPSALQAQVRRRRPSPELAPEKRLPVWLDTRNGIYYFPSDRFYGRTPNGKYLSVKAALRQGYHARKVP